MSYEQYWYGNAEIFWAYRTAFMNKLDFENEQQNYLSWLRGLYIYKAFHVVEYNMNRKPAEEPEDYFKEPIDFKKTKEEVKLTEQEKFEQRMKAFIESKKITLDKKKGKQ